MCENMFILTLTCTVLSERGPQRLRRTGSVNDEVYRTLRPESAGTDPPRIRVHRLHWPRQETPRLADVSGQI